MCHVIVFIAVRITCTPFTPVFKINTLTGTSHACVLNQTVFESKPNKSLDTLPLVQ